MKRARFGEILRLLAEEDVEFIVVGMTAGILQGAPVTTIDLDLVHRRTPDNVARLLKVLNRLDAVYRHDPRGLPPRESHLLGPGHQLLATTHGDVDCLGTIGRDLDFEALADRTIRLRLTDELSIRVLSLPALIAVKEQAGRPKDIAALPVLRATLDEMRRRS